MRMLQGQKLESNQRVSVRFHKQKMKLDLMIERLMRNVSLNVDGPKCDGLAAPLKRTSLFDMKADRAYGHVRKAPLVMAHYRSRI